MRKILIIIASLATILLLLLASIGGWAYYRFLYTEPLTTQELEELQVDWDQATRGNWSPWWDPGDGQPVWNPAASYNDWLASVPEDDKAWPLMIDAYYAHEPIFSNEYLGSMPTDGVEWERLTPLLSTPEADDLLNTSLIAFRKPVLGLWWTNSDPDPHEFAAQLKHTQPETDEEQPLREVHLPGTLSFDPHTNKAMIEILLPSLGKHRSYTNFVRSKAAYELEQGDAARFVESLEALLSSTHMSTEIPTLIGILVEVAIENVAIRTIDWGLSTHPDRFDAELLERLEHAVAQHADASYVWQGEAMMLSDTLRRVSDENGALKYDLVATFDNTGMLAGGFQTPTSLPSTQLHASSQRAMLIDYRVLRDAQAQALLPWDGQPSDAGQILDQQRGKLNFITLHFLDIMLPALDRAAMRVRQHTQEVIGLRLGIAAHRHHARHGSFPETIDDIDDDLLTFDPVDAFTGEPLGYTITKDGPLVYSVGPDRIDNAGRQGWLQKTGWDNKPYRVKKRLEWLTQSEAEHLAENPDAQWDWVLFPVPADERESPEPDYDPDWDLKQDGMHNKESGAKNTPEEESDG
ncbi:MAG: hypothetical protein ACX94C_02985 [Phycisphaerales bacterium]